ncbi:hypothetical protein C4580_06425 [Candidatus Woesearchaeota archaeon]|nr:MAG: hypothetical protein C4580_06425 [Candidatus Woesearchaeota archaeon]
MQVKFVLIVLFLAAVAFAQVPPADWVEESIKSDFRQLGVGFCRAEEQCLVRNDFNPDFDNNPNSYWDGLRNRSNGPKCINDTQYILDYYCDGGSWTSRTRRISEQLLAVALAQSGENFSLYCDRYDRVLNRYLYPVERGIAQDFLGKFCPQGFTEQVLEGCTNNMCVLRHAGGVAFGASLNSPVDNPQRSFLFALNRPSNECRNAVDDDGEFDPCGNNVWYDRRLNAVLYAPGVPSLPAPQLLASDFFRRPFEEKLHPYVFSFVHRPQVQRYNYSFFNQTPLFNYVYMAKANEEFVYAFKQENVTLFQIDFAGWYFSNIALPKDACARLMKRADSFAGCEQQPSPSEFFMAAQRTPPPGNFRQPSLVDAWSDVVGMLRVGR